MRERGVVAARKKASRCDVPCAALSSLSLPVLLSSVTWTSTVLMTPSSSSMYRPVMSPSSEEASKMEGSSKTNVATPDAPSRARVSLTSGTDVSLTPFTNWREVAWATSREVADRDGRRAGRRVATVM